MSLYVDTSALVKLVRRERETAVLRSYLGERNDLAVCVVGAVELCRAVRRAGDGADLVEPLLASLTLVSVTGSIVARAQALAPAELRTLDAIHLATALELGPELEAIVTYDARMADAARTHGLAVEAPTP